MRSTPQGSHAPTPASTSEAALEANASVTAPTPDAADGARAAQIDTTALGDDATALGDDATASRNEHWEVMWCYVGWYDVADRLERMLPPWAYLKRMAPGTPLSQQVRLVGEGATGEGWQGAGGRCWLSWCMPSPPRIQTSSTNILLPSSPHFTSHRCRAPTCSSPLPAAWDQTSSTRPPGDKGT